MGDNQTMPAGGPEKQLHHWWIVCNFKNLFKQIFVIKGTENSKVLKYFVKYLIIRVIIIIIISCPRR